MKKSSLGSSLMRCAAKKQVRRSALPDSLNI